MSTIIGFQPVLTAGLAYRPTTTTEVLKEGYLVAYSPTTSLLSGIDKPLLSNIGRACWIVSGQSTGAANGENNVVGIPVTERGGFVAVVKTDQTVAINDILSAHPGTYFARKGALFTKWGLRAIEAAVGTPSAPVDVRVEVIPVLSDKELRTSSYTYFNDFFNYTAADWTATVVQAGAGNAAIAITDEVGGVLKITNDDADDDSYELQLVGENFKLASGKPLYFAARLKASDATQSDIAVGLAVKDTTIITANQDSVLFVKDDGDANIDFETDKDATATKEDTTSDLVAATYVKLSFYFDGISSIYVYVDDVLKLTRTTNICDDEELSVTYAVRNGEAVAKNFSLDWILCTQAR